MKHLAGTVKRLPWPMPALLAWLTAWALWLALQAAGVAPGPAAGAALVAGALLALLNESLWRRLLAALGFPLSALAAGLAGGVPAWAWVAAAAPLLLIYPLRAWRDAPFFPTPAAALQGLERVVTPAPARLLEAGCGLGHGLAALHALWPNAAAEGVEWSVPMAWFSAWRCRWAGVRRADMWALNWSHYDLVYLFQRPESMARAWSKAAAEMNPGSWLVSLEFAVPQRAPHAVLQGADARPLWVYRVGAEPQHSIGQRAGR